MRAWCSACSKWKCRKSTTARCRSALRRARLARKVSGWDIDIKSEEEKRQEIEEQMTALTAPATPLTSLAGVGAKTIEKIEAAGINSVEKLAGMTPEQLMEIPGIGEKMVDK